jgi:methylated-DNA-[protein]-cysteine S-methyltransferase
MNNLMDISYASLDSPIGRMLAAATPAGVVRIAFESEPAERVLEELEVRFGARVATTAAGLDDARRQLDDYFAGRRRSFTFTLDWALTNGFRRRVLTETAEIPFGATSTYRTLAEAAGSPAAVRAAGSALASNPLPIVVPCHRVLRTDGGLGGFRGGLAAKRALLDHELGRPALAA